MMARRSEGLSERHKKIMAFLSHFRRTTGILRPSVKLETVLALNPLRWWITT
jgi:hypothetical protein